MPKEIMIEPYYKVNILTGTKGAKVVDDPVEAAKLISKAKNPLYIFGPETVDFKIGDKYLLEYAMGIANAKNIPICATAHVKKLMLGFGQKPDCVWDIIEIVHFLKMPDWQGVGGKGPHDFVIFTGVRCDLAERGLSTLKHFAPHLKTFAICRRSHPNADYALPIIRKMDKWQAYLEGVIKALEGDDGGLKEAVNA